MDEDERRQILYPDHPGFGGDDEPTTARITLTFDVICDEDPQYLADDMWALVKKQLEDRGAAVDGGTMVASTGSGGSDAPDATPAR